MELNNIRIEDRSRNLFSGVDAHGNRVRFDPGPDASKLLIDAMLSDLPFVGVSIDRSEIV